MKQKNRDTAKFKRQGVNFLFLLVSHTRESARNAQPGLALRVGREASAADTRPGASGELCAAGLPPALAQWALCRVRHGPPRKVLVNK